MKTRKYEAIFIVAVEKTDPEVQAVADHFKEVVEKNGGTVESAKKWEKRRMAFEINGHKEGNYVLMHFEATPEVPAELARLMRISDDIIRHRIFLRETDAGIPEASQVQELEEGTDEDDEMKSALDDAPSADGSDD